MATEPQKSEAAVGGLSRPYKWFITVYLLVWIGLSMKWCGEVDPTASSTAGLAYFFIPIWAAIYAIPFAILGYVLGRVSRKKDDDSGADPEGEQDE